MAEPRSSTPGAGRTSRERGSTAPSAGSTEIEIVTDTVRLPGFLVVPAEPRGLVVFAHGSGSSRFSRRNQQVAESLNESRFATLLFDLLTAEENEEDEFTRRHRFNIPLLAGRLAETIDFVSAHDQVGGLPLGLFGASTGAAAALIAAAQRPEQVAAVVSRGGRPDLAGDALEQVRAPVLLLVGGFDIEVIDLNRRAASRLLSPHRTVIVPGASHLFEEPGKLEEVQALARDFFDEFLNARRGA